MHLKKMGACLDWFFLNFQQHFLATNCASQDRHKQYRQKPVLSTPPVKNFAQCSCRGKAQWKLGFSSFWLQQALLTKRLAVQVCSLEKLQKNLAGDQIKCHSVLGLVVVKAWNQLFLNFSQVIALADFNTVVTKDGVNNRDVKINIGHGMIQ